MARTRSPNYPSMSLRQAIDQVRKVYMKEHTHKSPPDVVVKAMGYGGLNGSSAVALSALKKYGLLDEDGENLKVSTDALTILVDPLDSKERAEAIERAAFKPTLFSELQKEYGRSPPSDESLRAFLLKRGFHPESTDHPIKAYRDTLKLLTEQPEPKDDSPQVAFAVPIIGDEPKIEVGDVIQWEAAGALRLEAPRKVRAKAEHDGSWWLFVEGSETGIPMEEAVLVERGTPDAVVSKPPVLPLMPVPLAALGEREWVRGPLSKVASFRLMVSGELGPKELGKLITLLEAQKAILSDDDEEAPH